jgi:hypothetical protein
MEMDWERDEAKRRYMLCRLGFALTSLGLGLLFIDQIVVLSFMFTFHPDIRAVLQSEWWDWGVGAPITWSTLIGAYLLWGRQRDPVWQRQAGVLVILNFVDFGFWSLRHANGLGFNIPEMGHPWLVYNITQGTGWIENILFASLASELMARVGKTDAAEAGMGARSLAWIGTLFWLMSFVFLTNWSHWPLVPLRGRDLRFAQMGTDLLSTIASFQVTCLTVAASRYCGQVLAAMRKEEQADDLLRSRSESFGNDPQGWFTANSDAWPSSGSAKHSHEDRSRDE